MPSVTFVAGASEHKIAIPDITVIYYIFTTSLSPKNSLSIQPIIRPGIPIQRAQRTLGVARMDEDAILESWMRLSVADYDSQNDMA